MEVYVVIEHCHNEITKVDERFIEDIFFTLEAAENFIRSAQIDSDSFPIDLGLKYKDVEEQRPYRTWLSADYTESLVMECERWEVK